MSQHEQGMRQPGGDTGRSESRESPSSTGEGRPPKGRFTQSGGGADGNMAERQQQQQKDLQHNVQQQQEGDQGSKQR